MLGTSRCPASCWLSLSVPNAHNDEVLDGHLSLTGYVATGFKESN